MSCHLCFFSVTIAMGGTGAYTPATLYSKRGKNRSRLNAQAYLLSADSLLLNA